ncbi:MAG: phosphatidylglycerophosphatase A [Bdellovibrionales bacterium]
MSQLGRQVIVVLSTWFGCGRFPKGPGTAGTLGAIPLVWAFAQIGPMPYLVATFLTTVIAMVVAQLYEDMIIQSHDAPEFVLDEVAGFLITMAWIPLTPIYLIAGFVLFRVLDIWKPFPISYLDRKVPGGIGTVADDLVAGIVANVILQFVFTRGLL